MASAAHQTRGWSPINQHQRGWVRRHEWQHRLAPLPRPLVDHLIAPDERLPGVANMAMMEQRLSLVGMFDDAKAGASFYRAWGARLFWRLDLRAEPAVNGGVWIWRYQAMLRMLAEARAYGQAPKHNSAAA